MFYFWLGYDRSINTGNCAHFKVNGQHETGTLILVQRNIPTIIHKTIKDTHGRFLIVDMTVKDQRLVLCSIYAPNEDKVEFFQTIFAKIESIEPKSIIIAGDINTALDKQDIKAESTNAMPGHPKCAEFIKEFMFKHNLIDIWRARYPDTQRYTWVKSKPRILMERLDYILLSANLTNEVMDAGIDPTFKSDHAIPYVMFSDKVTSTKGPGYWKFNTKYLEDPEYLSICREIFLECEKYPDLFTRWEMVKMKVRGESIKYGVRKKKSRQNQLEALENKLYKTILERDSLKMKKAPSTQTFHDHEDHIALLQKDIDNIMTHQVEASSLSNNVNWYAFGEKSSKYFFKLEKPSFKKPLTRVSIDNNIIEEENQVLDELKLFYQKLFTANVDIDESGSFLDDLNIPQVTDEDKVILDSPILLEEVKIAINQLKSNKAPGLDGFPADFYKAFYKELDCIVHSLCIRYTDAGLNPSAKQGLISLLEKPGKDQLRIESWRPLALLGSDYKIYAKILANRLSLVTPYTIHADQSGFLKNRFIAQNLMDLNAVIATAEEKGYQATVTAIDFHKAYDTVEWKSLYKILKSFGFGDKFISMVAVCQTNISSAIINNGNRSEFFELSRGLRQGCPLSCLLFDFVVEIIGIKIRQSQDVEGIPITDKVSKKLAQYADDLWVAMLHKKSCYTAMFTILKEFERFTGLAINYNKTEIRQDL